MSELQTAVAEAAAQRCDYSLVFERARKPRQLHPGVMIGDDIADAYHPGRYISGQWVSDAPDGYYDDKPLTQDDFIDHYASMAINETVHEALEWFRVDGKPWLDPHDPAVENAIFDKVAELVDHLIELRGRRDSL